MLPLSQDTGARCVEALDEMGLDDQQREETLPWDLFVETILREIRERVPPVRG